MKVVLVLLLLVFIAGCSTTGDIAYEPRDSPDPPKEDAAPPEEAESQRATTPPLRDSCESVFCERSILECGDGFIASCENSCFDGECSSCIPTCAGHIPAEIVFFQVLYDPVGEETEGEWFSLMNPTDQTKDLTGWSVTDNTGTWTFPASMLLPHSTLTIARNAAVFQERYGCLPGIGGFTRGLNNNGDHLSLRNQEGQEIAFVAWEGGAEGEFPAWDIVAKEGETLQWNGEEWESTEPASVC